ncbi:hypothetical protein CDD80_4754 [Ophiocordyceps camponoti-rufipedis]|uniref:Uncharacterized protein n=1 Tax=Ophiocordyceps camponoti-rufipedis TaxID=2004952 RepID=A0A2C5YX72_9HYPO|nr:hypothetical protein CDD80_4754 [Ophiocordyceps camponoti-rufipedis]
MLTRGRELTPWLCEQVTAVSRAGGAACAVVKLAPATRQDAKPRAPIRAASAKDVASAAVERPSTRRPDDTLRVPIRPPPLIRGGEATCPPAKLITTPRAAVWFPILMLAEDAEGLPVLWFVVRGAEGCVCVAPVEDGRVWPFTKPIPLTPAEDGRVCPFTKLTPAEDGSVCPPKAILVLFKLTPDVPQVKDAVWPSIRASTSSELSPSLPHGYIPPRQPLQPSALLSLTTPTTA